MAYILSSSELVAAYWLDIPGIWLCWGGDSNVSEISYAQVLFTYTVWHI